MLFFLFGFSNYLPPGGEISYRGGWIAGFRVVSTVSVAELRTPTSISVRPDSSTDGGPQTLAHLRLGYNEVQCVQCPFSCSSEL